MVDDKSDREADNDPQCGRELVMLGLNSNGSEVSWGDKRFVMQERLSRTSLVGARRP